uniref:Pheromone phb3.3 n=1 Tax=Pleurotus eryngii var. eryngii TaxID=280321 RepID=X2DA97_PLEER|nr:pheromone phb3.3 [Pleurotus eryngii var. eryngii]
MDTFNSLDALEQLISTILPPSISILIPIESHACCIDDDELPIPINEERYGGGGVTSSWCIIS